MTDISDTPLALLLWLDRSERVWPLATLPPPHELLVPATASLSVKYDPNDCFRLEPDRVFRLSPRLRTSSHRWWETYNDGRSRTPQDGFVYLEVGSRG